MATIVAVRISAGDVTWGISSGDRFCVSRKGGMRGGGWVHLQGENGKVQSWTGRRKPLLGAGWAVSFVFCMNRRSKQPYHLHFKRPWLFFCTRAGCHCPREYWLASGRGQVRELTWEAVFTSVCSLEHENPRELGLEYVIVIHQLKTDLGM